MTEDETICFRSYLKKQHCIIHEFTEDIDEKTPNWDTDRIAEVDLILNENGNDRICIFSIYSDQG